MNIKIGDLKELKQDGTVHSSVTSQDASCEHDIKRRINLATGVAAALA